MSGPRGFEDCLFGVAGGEGHGLAEVDVVSLLGLGNDPHPDANFGTSLPSHRSGALFLGVTAGEGGVLMVVDAVLLVGLGSLADLSGDREGVGLESRWVVLIGPEKDCVLLGVPEKVTLS